MEIKYLETVLTVAELRSFSRAAEEIPCAQSSVSRQVGIVEKELGARLFSRSASGKVELTDYGEKAFPAIHRIVEEYQKLLGSTDRAVPGRRIPYRLGIYPGPFNARFRGSLIAQMYLYNPDISLSLTVVHRRLWGELFLHDKVDAVIMYRAFIEGRREEVPPPPPAPGVVCHELFRMEPCIAMPACHPLAGRTWVELGELREETFLLPDLGRDEDNDQGDTAMNLGFLLSCRAAGFEPKVERIMEKGEIMAEIRDAAVIKYGRMYPTFQTKAMRRSDVVALVPIRKPLYYAQYCLFTSGKKPQLDQRVCGFLKKSLTTDELV